MRVGRVGAIVVTAVVVIGAAVIAATLPPTDTDGHGKPRATGTLTEPGDLNATDGYLTARRAMVQALDVDLADGRTRMAAVVARIGAGCPGVLRDAPTEAQASSGSRRNESLLLYELLNALTVAQRRAGAKAVRRFVRAATAIKWHDPRVTNLVHALAHVEGERLRVALPAVCRDLKAWAATGYRRLPMDIALQMAEPDEEMLRKDARALGCTAFVYTLAPEAAVLEALRRYQRRGAPVTAEELGRLESTVKSAEARLRRQELGQVLKRLGAPSSRDRAVRQLLEAGSRSGASPSRVPACAA
jgi:hypothetical protein